MIEVGGEIRTRGRNAEGRPWQLAIERPDAMPQRAMFVVPIDGKVARNLGRLPQLLHARGAALLARDRPGGATPVGHALASVSVVADDCTHADAWSTALFVLGPERGFETATRHELAAYFVERQPDGSFATGRPRPSPRSAGTPRAERDGA